MKYIICILILVIIIAKLHTTTDTPITYADTTNWRYQFAIELLHKVGNDNPTQFMIQEIINWTKSEDNTDNAFNRNNPLNTTLCAGKDTGSCNNAIDATIETLTNGFYNDIIIALQTNDADGFKHAVWNSPWAESHYRYGKDWVK